MKVQVSYNVSAQQTTDNDESSHMYLMTSEHFTLSLTLLLLLMLLSVSSPAAANASRFV